MTRQVERVKYAFGSIQALAGTPETLVLGDVLRTQNAQFMLYDGNSQERADDGPAGVDPTIRTREHNTFTADIEMAGAGTGTPNVNPNLALDLFFRAAGYDYTDVATVGSESRTYTLTTDFASHEFATLRLERPMDIATTYDCRAIGSLAIADGIPTISSTFKGRFVDIANDSGQLIVPGVLPTYVQQARALPMNQTNTPTLTLDGVAVCLTDFSLDNFGFDLVVDDSYTCDGFQLSRVVQTGTITIIAPDIAVKDFYALAKTGGAIQEVPFAWTQGTAITNRFYATSSAVQILPGITSSGASSGGFQTLSMPVKFFDPLEWKLG